MKLKFIIIGIVLALMLCISPVAAVSGDDFEIEFDDESGWVYTYKYRDLNDPDERYIHIHTRGTLYCDSFVTFKPANIPDAPVMVVDTNGKCDICLTNTVDEWEIKYYSRFWNEPTLEGKYLKREGVVNLNEEFRKSLSHVEWLNLELSNGQYIFAYYIINDHVHVERWYFPDVD